MKLVTDTVLVEDNWDVEEAFGCSLEGCGHLVLSNDTQTWDFLLQNASSFSCSLGSGVASWLGPKLSMLPEKELEQRPVLYACENDSAAVKDLQVGGLGGLAHGPPACRHARLPRFPICIYLACAMCTFVFCGVVAPGHPRPLKRRAR